MPEEIKDGLVLFYIKSGTVYPVGLTQEQHTMFELLQGMLCQEKPIAVFFDKPMGEAEFIKPSKN